jgi:hypothetical protein
MMGGNVSMSRWERAEAARRRANRARRDAGHSATTRAATGRPAQLDPAAWIRGAVPLRELRERAVTDVVVEPVRLRGGARGSPGHG